MKENLINRFGISHGIDMFLDYLHGKNLYAVWNHYSLKKIKQFCKIKDREEVDF